MRVVGIVSIAGAFLLISASMTMNWTYWNAQGATPVQGLVFACVSIGIDAFKVCLPFVAASTFARRQHFGFGLAAVLTACCLLFSLVSAIGYATLSRGMTTGQHESITQRYSSARDEAARLDARLAALGEIRATTVVQEDLGRLRQDQRWMTSQRCEAATVAASFTYCRDVGALRVELAKANEAEQLETTIRKLRSDMAQLIAHGARAETDAQAGIIAKITGLNPDGIRTAITLFFAGLVEVLAAFGLYLAHPLVRSMRSLPISDRSSEQARANGVQTAVPTRLVRTRDGRLLVA